MNYTSLRQCVDDLERHGHLVRIAEEVDPNLEMAEIHRRVFRAGGPAILYECIKGSPFVAVSNLFGTMERAKFIFRETLGRVKKIFSLKADPFNFHAYPKFLFSGLRAGATAFPKRVNRGPVLEQTCRVQDLPRIKCWPEDGGGFILLPQVYTENPDRTGILSSNLGMYRIQMDGNDYVFNKELGLHYQIRRDIGIHHSKSVSRNQPLRVSIFVGGPPAHSLAAAMYFPEGLSELLFAGMLGGRRLRYCRQNGFTISTDADFCLTGWVDPNVLKPEGPFGDHLGYYSLRHDYPVFRIEQIYHRKNAIWPFTVVGKPPQEDSVIGKLVQEIGGVVIPKEIPGVKAVHAVDASGVHPLLLAIGSERYEPYRTRKPQELHTLAHAILGYGPCALAKYLVLVAGEDDPHLNILDVPSFFGHFLQRVDWKKNLHFETKTTMDTLDYTGPRMNEGSKVIMLAAGNPVRKLTSRLPQNFSLPDSFSDPCFTIPGVLLLKGACFRTYEMAKEEMARLNDAMKRVASQDLDEIPFIIIMDDTRSAAMNFNDFLWTTFTRSDPARDIYGIDDFVEHKHWGCKGSLIIDARLKPHHAPPLIEDRMVTQRVDRLAVRGKPLHGII